MYFFSMMKDEYLGIKSRIVYAYLCEDIRECDENEAVQNDLLLNSLAMENKECEIVKVDLHEDVNSFVDVKNLVGE